MFRRKEKVEVEEAEAFVDKWEGNTGSTQSDSDSESLQPCQKCGHKLTPDVIFCPKCGAKREDLDRGCCRCGWRCCCCCCLYSLLSTALLIGLVVLLAMSMNTWVRVGLEEVGDAVFGTEVKIGALNLGLQDGRASITNATVHSPPGYQGSFFTLGRLVFDMNPRSLFAAWMSGWIEPIELEELTIRGIKVFIDMNWTTSEDKDTVSNAQTIVENLNEAVEPLPTPTPEEAEEMGLHALEAKIKVGRLELADIDAGILLRPFLGETVDWKIKEVVVTNLGENSNGIYVWEFVEILTRSILMAVIKGAPTNVRANLAKVFGEQLFRSMDFGEIMYDTGDGLTEISRFTGWAAGEATLLPLKFAALQAKITGKAIETQAKLGLEGLKVGTKLTGMGIRANMAATNAVVKAGIKANEEAMKIRNAFTFGWMKALR